MKFPLAVWCQIKAVKLNHSPSCNLLFMCGKWHWVISIIKRKTAVTPLLMHWSYCCHVPIHWEIVCSAAAWPWVLARMSTRIFTGCGLRGVRRWPQATRQCRVRQQRARRTEYHGLICQVEYQLCGSVSNIVMALCKTAVSPLLTHWRYCSHALSLQYSLFFFFLKCMICCTVTRFFVISFWKH